MAPFCLIMGMEKGEYVKLTESENFILCKSSTTADEAVGRVQLGTYRKLLPAAVSTSANSPIGTNLGPMCTDQSTRWCGSVRKPGERAGRHDTNRRDQLACR